MNEYLNNDNSRESSFRSVFLFGRNTATYKFALAEALHQLSKEDKTFISLEDLSPYFAKSLLEHIKTGKTQITSSRSLFLNAFALYEQDQITWDQLMEATKKTGFTYVLDAFHKLPGLESEHKFFEKTVQGRTPGITLTDDLFLLNESAQWANIQDEIEGRWNLVENAFTVKDSSLQVNYDEELQKLFLLKPITAERFATSHMRIDLTSVRKPLNGYQKGKCFYCHKPISIISGVEETCDVDHFIPFNTQAYSALVLGNDDLGLNGVWNLVLACQDCNRGDHGKFAHIPDQRLLDRLLTRNEYLIESNHPLKETLIVQTGKNKELRTAFIKRLYKLAEDRNKGTCKWFPREVHDSSF